MHCGWVNWGLGAANLELPHVQNLELGSFPCPETSVEFGLSLRLQILIISSRPFQSKFRIIPLANWNLMFTMSSKFAVCMCMALAIPALAAPWPKGPGHGHGKGLGHSGAIKRIHLGPRPFWLIEQMEDSPLKRKLESCTEMEMRPSAWSISHRGGGTLQFPEETYESIMAGVSFLSPPPFLFHFYFSWRAC
jgi:hypothetical protein